MRQHLRQAQRVRQSHRRRFAVRKHQALSSRQERARGLVTEKEVPVAVDKHVGIGREIERILKALTMIIPLCRALPEAHERQPVLLHQRRGVVESRVKACCGFRFDNDQEIEDLSVVSKQGDIEHRPRVAARPLRRQIGRAPAGWARQPSDLLQPINEGRRGAGRNFRQDRCGAGLRVALKEHCRRPIARPHRTAQRSKEHVVLLRCQSRQRLVKFMRNWILACHTQKIRRTIAAPPFYCIPEPVSDITQGARPR